MNGRYSTVLESPNNFIPRVTHGQTDKEARQNKTDLQMSAMLKHWTQIYIIMSDFTYVLKTPLSNEKPRHLMILS